MLRLLIGNKTYSSWSLRGWLAVRQSGLPFEEVVVPLYDADWPARRQAPEFAPSAGRVPILWDGEIVLWDSLAILDFLADRVGRARFWPADEGARGLARSIAAEMHSGYPALRARHGMNIRRRYPAQAPDADVAAELERIVALWRQARALHGAGGDFLFGAFGAADIMFAPVVTRIATYALPVPRFARAYCDALTAHPFVQDWIAAAQDEEWVIDRFERPGPA